MPRRSWEPHGELVRLLTARPLWLVLMLSLTLNLWGNHWGLFNAWHADELSAPTETLLQRRSVNPHYFMYGNIAYYKTALTVGPAIRYTEAFDPPPNKSNASEYEQWRERFQRRIALWPRVISAIEAVGLVLLTCLIGALLFDYRVGVLAGATLALSPTVVYIGHVATVDGFANLVEWSACLAAVLWWRRGDARALALSMFLAGVAIGTKTDHVFVIVPVLLAYVWGENHRRWHALLLPLLPAGYLFANPILVLSPFEFIDGLSRDMFFGMVQDTGTVNSYRLLLEYLWIGLGWPLVTLVTVSVGYAILCIARGIDRRELTWLLSSFVPYYALLGGRSVYPWYIEQLLPGLHLLGGYGGIRLLRSVPRPRRRVAQGALALLLLLALLGPISLDLQFTHDPRDTATAWIKEHVPANATIFVSERGPWLPPNQYRIETMLPDRERWSQSALPVARLDHHQLYQRVRRSILASERWAGERLGTPVRAKPYHGWYDDVITDLAVRPGAAERVQQARPDFIVIVQGMSPALLGQVRAPDSEYREVAAFAYRSPVRGSLWMPMLNQRVWIFQRRSAPTPG